MADDVTTGMDLAGIAADYAHDEAVWLRAELARTSVAQCAIWENRHDNRCNERDRALEQLAEVRAELARVEASRRDWAAHASDLDAALESLVQELSQRGQERDEVGSDDGNQCDGACDSSDCHTVSAVATWGMAANRVRARLNELRDPPEAPDA